MKGTKMSKGATFLCCIDIYRGERDCSGEGKQTWERASNKPIPSFQALSITLQILHVGALKMCLYAPKTTLRAFSLDIPVFYG